MKNYIITGIVAVLVGFAIGFLAFGRQSLVGAVSSSGTTNLSVGFSQVTFTPSVASSTSLLNNGASDRAITQVTNYCSSVGTSYTYSTGTGLVAWTLTLATSTIAASSNGNTNYIFTATVPTSTPNVFIASSTGSIQTSSAIGSSGSTSLVWPVNSYLNFGFNATNTASCSLSVSWLPL